MLDVRPEADRFAATAHLDNRVGDRLDAPKPAI